MNKSYQVVFVKPKEVVLKETKIPIPKKGEVLIKTILTQISTGVVRSYKELANVEGEFREFKDVLEGKPIYHHTADRVRAHVLVRALGYLLDTALKRAMDRAGVNLTVEEAIESLSQITIADLRLRGEKHQIILGAKRYARSVLNAVGLSGYKNLLPQQISGKNAANDKHELRQIAVTIY